MNTIYVDDGFGNPVITDNDENLKSCINSLIRNNTFFPNIVNIKTDYIKVRDKNAEKAEENKAKKNKKKYEFKKIIRDCKQMTVRFSDDTWVQVKLNPQDSDDPMTALLYAMVKRLFGEPNHSGYVNGSQFMNKLKKMLDNAQTPEKEAKEKELRAKEKAANDKKAHEDAIARKNAHPSLRQCVIDLADVIKGLKEKIK